MYRQIHPALLSSLNNNSLNNPFLIYHRMLNVYRIENKHNIHDAILKKLRLSWRFTIFISLLGIVISAVLYFSLKNFFLNLLATLE